MQREYDAAAPYLQSLSLIYGKRDFSDTPKNGTIFNSNYRRVKNSQNFQLAILFSTCI